MEIQRDTNNHRRASSLDSPAPLVISKSKGGGESDERRRQEEM